MLLCGVKVVMYEAGKLWERIEIMLASAVILVAERAWSWAYYDANLPHMKKYIFIQNYQ